MKGKIIFELTNIGTKSEFELPFLVLEDGKKVKIGFKGDNPFEQPTLHLYDQKEVLVEGDFNENGKFIATAIAEVTSDTEPNCDEQTCPDEELCAQTCCECESSEEVEEDEATQTCCESEACEETQTCQCEEKTEEEPSQEN